MSSKNKRRKRKRIPTEAQRRKKRVAMARFRVLCLILLVGAGIFGAVKFSKSIEVPLNVNAADYYQIIENSEVTDRFDGDTAEPAEEVSASLSKYSVPQPRLKDEYAIEETLQSKYAIVYDVQADEVLFAKNAEEKCFPASTTKILTAAVILDNAPEDFQFTAGDELDFVNPESSLAFVNKGNVLDLEMTIDALMLPSGNDAAYMAAANMGRYIAKNDGLSPEQAVKTFVDEMNRTAMLLGAENTHFTAPDGFHDDDHYTTVLDMLKITLYAMDKPKLTASAAKPSTYTTFLTGEEVSWTNSNKLIQETSGDCYYLYANGMKTGMTDQSGYCVVATARRFDHDVICIVFGAEASDIRWNETIALLDAAFVQVKNRNGEE
ncbi:MAG: D-alanyl-D-alanine carboxypeptidase [Ruminococcus sp.]|nr:D-alanyl-D-alanine carboxypeptidase [Ruminococcus sp.]MCM1381016.1 D-alanyl-D-alanine carboxypeptidase [Muribaculaceae bacterium]